MTSPLSNNKNKLKKHFTPYERVSRSPYVSKLEKRNVSKGTRKVCCENSWDFLRC